LWEDVEVTAVEIDPDIAKIYQDYFPDDTVIVGDAHQYLLDHFKEFDFIWSSPPCPTHSRFRFLWKSNGNKINADKASGSSFKFPDMKLYEEIIFLNHFFEGKFCVENVISYYTPLVQPVQADNHYFWANFRLSELQGQPRNIRRQEYTESYGFNLSGYNLKNRFKRTLLNNLVKPKLGLYILNCARGILTKQNEKQIDLFEK